MAEFSKSLSRLIITAVSLLGFLTIFFAALKSPLTSLLALSMLLFGGFISLAIYYIIKLENKINSIEEKFKREEDLKDIRKDVEALKLVLLKK